jgi:predicted nucleic acid-binding Zn ribbon protein
MRGRRRTIAAALGDALSARPGAEPARLAAAFAEACGPRLAKEASLRGLTGDGRLLVLVRTEAWAEQIRRLETELCGIVNARLGRRVAGGLDVRVAGSG